MQEIIVYASPGEKMVWDLVQSGDLVPFMGGMIAAAIVFVILDKLTRKIIPRVYSDRTQNPRRYKIAKVVNSQAFQLTIAALVGILVCKWLWI